MCRNAWHIFGFDDYIPVWHIIALHTGLIIFQSSIIQGTMMQSCWVGSGLRRQLIISPPPMPLSHCLLCLLCLLYQLCLLLWMLHWYRLLLTYLLIIPTLPTSPFLVEYTTLPWYLHHPLPSAQYGAVPKSQVMQQRLWASNRKRAGWEPHCCCHFRLLLSGQKAPAAAHNGPINPPLSLF